MDGIGSASEGGSRTCCSLGDEGYEKLFSLLLKANADLTIPNSDGYALVMLASSRKAPSSYHHTPLTPDSRTEGDTELVARLIEAGVDLNAADNSGWTPVHAASVGSTFHSLTYTVVWK